MTAKNQDTHPIAQIAFDAVRARGSTLILPPQGQRQLRQALERLEADDLAPALHELDKVATFLGTRRKAPEAGRAIRQEVQRGLHRLRKLEARASTSAQRKARLAKQRFSAFRGERSDKPAAPTPVGKPQLAVTDLWRPPRITG